MELCSKKKKETQFHEINFTGQVPSWSYMLTDGGDAEDDMEGLILIHIYIWEGS